MIHVHPFEFQHDEVCLASLIWQLLSGRSWSLVVYLRQTDVMTSELNLKSRIQHDISEAVRSGDELVKSTLRMALAAIMNAEVAGKEVVVLSEDQCIAVVRSELKKRLESAQIYEDAGRVELAVRERGEVAILEKYLPAAMDAAVLAGIVAEEVQRAAEQGQTGPKAMGAVIKAVRERAGDGADGSTISAAVKAALG